MTPESNPIAVAMSGGVDSSTVAAILREQGCAVVGLTMQLWNQRRLPQLLHNGAPTGGRCCSLDDVYDARRVAEHLDFPFYVINFERQFEETVVKPFVSDYLAGRTPIPCSRCNTDVKFEELLRTARQIGAGRLATGHYARIRHNAATNRYELLRARDDAKDQSYFLFGLTQEQMAHTDFPLGELTKSEVREIARRAKLPVAEKPESQEICFVPTGNYAEFIEAYLHEQGSDAAEAEGEIVTTNGEVIGHHSGLHHYTVGQRRGLGLAAGRPLYVVSLDTAGNRLVVGDDADLARDTCDVRDVNWIPFEKPQGPLEAQVKIRHRHEPADAVVEPLEESAKLGCHPEDVPQQRDGRRISSVRVRFHTPQRAVTPGQAAVFYSGDLVLGGGWIL